MPVATCSIGPSRVLDNLITTLPRKSPCSSTKPSFGIITSQPKPRKSRIIFTTGLESDCNLGFTSRKPKLKWNLTKFDFSQTSKPEPDSPSLDKPIGLSSVTVKNIPTSGQIDFGKLQSTTTNSRLSIPTSLPFPLTSLTPWEEKSPIRNSWKEPSNNQTIFESTPSTGEVLTAPQQPQNSIPRLLPSTAPLPRYLTVVPVKSIFVPVTTGIRTPSLPRLISSFGNPLASLSPYEEYIFSVTKQPWHPDPALYQRTTEEGDPDTPDITLQLRTLYLRSHESNPFF